MQPLNIIVMSGKLGQRIYHAIVDVHNLDLNTPTIGFRWISEPNSWSYTHDGYLADEFYYQDRFWTPNGILSNDPNALE